jgi:DNA-binding beta-propeller fold protein YncE
MKLTMTIQVLLSLFCAAQIEAHPGSGIVVDSAGQVYFVLYGPHNRIMKIDTKGLIMPFIIDKRLRGLHHLVIDSDDNLYTASDHDGKVWQIAPNAEMTQFYSPKGWKSRVNVGIGGDPFTLDAKGNIYCIGEKNRNQIFKITPKGEITPLTSLNDGKGNAAKFGDLHGASMVWGPDEVLYVTDERHIRKVAQNGIVSTLTDNRGKAVEFELATGIAFDSQGNIYVADHAAERILKITPDGIVTTVAGSDVGFFRPTGVAIGLAGHIYVLDFPPGATRVWKIMPEGGVSIIAEVKS